MNDPLLLDYPLDRVRIPTIGTLAFRMIEQGDVVRFAPVFNFADRSEKGHQLPPWFVFRIACRNYQKRYRRRAPNDYRRRPA